MPLLFKKKNYGFDEVAKIVERDPMYLLPHTPQWYVVLSYSTPLKAGNYIEAMSMCSCIAVLSHV